MMGVVLVLMVIMMVVVVATGTVSSVAPGPALGRPQGPGRRSRVPGSGAAPGGGGAVPRDTIYDGDVYI
ncbi:hypothetical protein E2C01_035739 [Portunus trituberculatus]|uniref:Uncharacterized protein n=1 Tax=Portunus trituberculatus TaxID=210409 RepID=A0A5B7F958_PORTR|nr:hypothetical protein [Portunus trituberculatus]